MATSYLIFVLVLQFGIIARALLREGLSPTARLAWVAVIAALPGVGIAGYFLFGEIRLARAKRQRIREVRTRLIAAHTAGQGFATSLAGLPVPAFAAGRATSDFDPVHSNSAVLLPEGDAMMEDMFEAIEKAREHVHILFYIWLPDTTGARMARALCDAAARGVACRVLVDDHGSRRIIRSVHWAEMASAGVVLERASPVGNPFVSFLFQRLDLRNHRKIVVVDNAISWCGSRNCADAAFAIKAKYAPWVDIMVRLEGPVVRQQQAVFLQDWMIQHHEDLSELLSAPMAVGGHGDVIAQVVASGPDDVETSPSDALCALIYAATERMWLTTPYYVPDQGLHIAIRAAAERGVDVRMILPARNDSRITGAASESLFPELLRSGVQIHLFNEGLIHSKIVTVDGRFGMIGTANLDHRSFDLNYENSLLFQSDSLVAALDTRQQSYIDRARTLSRDEVARWHLLRRLRNNVVALASPLL